MRNPKLAICAIILLLRLVNAQGQRPQLVAPIGHTLPYHSMALSPDGQYILTGSEDKTAILWDLNGHQLKRFTGNCKEVVSVQFSPDGQTFLMVSRDTAKIWNLNSRRPLQTLAHNGWIKNASFSADGKKLLTLGQKGDLRVWSISGALLGAFPDSGEVCHAAVFDPLGKSILTGGLNGVKEWSLEGQLLHSVPLQYLDLPDQSDDETIDRLSFSPNGQYLRVGFKGKGEKIVDKSGKEVKAIQTGSPVLNIWFAEQDMFVLNSDSTLSIWDYGLKKSRSIKGDDENTPFLVAPNGRFLPKHAIPHLTGKAAPVHAVAFSPDGQTFLTGSTAGSAKWWKPKEHITETIVAKKKLDEFDQVNIATAFGIFNTPSDLAFSPDGHSILITEGEMVYQWSLPDTTKRIANAWKASYSSDGKKILVGERGGASLIPLDGRPGVSVNVLHNPMTDFIESDWWTLCAMAPDGKSFITSSESDSAILWDLNGKELRSFSNFYRRINSLAFAPDGKSVLLGGEGNEATLWNLANNEYESFLRPSSYDGAIISAAFSPNGQQIVMGSSDGSIAQIKLASDWNQPFEGHLGGVADIAYSPDGKYVLSGSDDNTAKLWDRNSGKELCTLVSINARDWMVTTPAGLFDASPGAMEELYYVLGLEVIELEQLKERYYEPDLLAKLMGFSEEPLREVAGFDTVALYPSVQLKLDTVADALQIFLIARNGGIGKVSVFVNEKEIIEDANPINRLTQKRNTFLTIPLEKYERYFLHDSLNTLSVRAYNEAGWLKNSAYSIRYKPAQARSKGDPDAATGKEEERLEGPPNLYILSVGTSRYASAALKLKYADKDATDISKALEQIGRQLLKGTKGQVFVKLITTDSNSLEVPSKVNIKTALDSIKAHSKAEDILIVYFSGHGKAQGDQFYYLTKDIGSFEISDEGIQKKYTISSDELTNWIKAVPARKQVLILDACNSGKVVENLASSARGLNTAQVRALERLKDRTGMFVLSGSTADKLSYESSRFDQGLLTYSLLQGLKILDGKNNTPVDVMSWFQQACNEVPKLAKAIKGIQTPMLVGPIRGSFDVGIVNDSVKIVLKDSLPVVIRSSFVNEDLFIDDLGISRSFDNQLSMKSAGDRPPLIFVEVNEYEGALSVRGLYKVTGNTVRLRARVLQGSKPLKESLEVTASTDPDKLAKAILKIVWPILIKK